jgi:hypothetical protein
MWSTKPPSMRRPQHFPTYGIFKMIPALKADIRARKTKRIAFP